ncbi:hypothetical protein IKG06_00605 [Candidatus Saccharibacteria bacterium]|nr:hypothetical protein [Candidatus Saccharibacteria bacterium]
MKLITVLLIAVAALAVLTGFSILCGTTKQSRMSGLWFFIGTLGAAVWSVAIAVFLTLPTSMSDSAPALVISVISGITLTDVALLGYAGWSNGRSGKILVGIFALLGIALCVLLAQQPELFYSHFTFGQDFNTIHTTRTWYFYALIAFFTIISLVYSGYLSKTIKHTKNHGAKNGLRIFQAGLSVGGILALVFDLLLLTSQPHLAWIGPMAVSISIITFYYSVVKYRILSLSGKWLEVLSYIILIAAAVIVYTLIFYAIFTTVFSVASPSIEILLLNFVMVIILLCLMPALREVLAMLKSILPTRNIDIGYITRKILALKRDRLDLKELAGFLATQLKLDYFAFLINGKVYGSKTTFLTSEELVKIGKLKHPTRSIWQTQPGENADSPVRVAALVDSNDEVFGQALVGRSNSGHSLEHRDLIQIEMVINLSASVIGKNKGL